MGLPSALEENENDEKVSGVGSIPFDVPDFPTEVFPDPLRKMIEEAADALHCPKDFLGVPLIVNLGTAIGTTCELQVKKGWKEGPRFYAAIVADPGSKKSPALATISTPLTNKQEEYHNDFEKREQEYKEEYSTYEGELDRWKSDQRKAEKNRENIEKPLEPEPPVMKNIMTTDATVESLADLLKNNPRGMTFHRDELTGWINEMGQYKAQKGGDLEKWLSFWNGSPIVINRKSQKGKPIYVKNPLVNVIGAIVPDRLDSLAGDGKEDGFIHRILFSYPQEMNLQWTEETVSEQTERNFHKTFEQLFQLEHETDENGKPKPITLSFTDEGKAIWVQWIKEHYAEQSEPDFHYKLKYPWAKMEGYAARLALVLQLSRWACGETETQNVDQVSMIGAAVLIDYFKKHCKKVYAKLRADPQDQRLMDVIQWIQKRGGEVMARDVARYGVGGVDNVNGAKSLFEQLEKRNVGFIKEGKRGSVGFVLSPPDTRHKDEEPLQ